MELLNWTWWTFFFPKIKFQILLQNSVKKYFPFPLYYKKCKILKVHLSISFKFLHRQKCILYLKH